MDLELAVAQAAFSVGQIARAIHDEGPWSVQIAGVRSRFMNRRVETDGVVFAATFDSHEWPSRTMTAALMCNGDVVGVREVEVSDGAFALTWTFALPVLAVAA